MRGHIRRQSRARAVQKFRVWPIFLNVRLVGRCFHSVLSCDIVSFEIINTRLQAAGLKQFSTVWVEDHLV